MADVRLEHPLFFDLPKDQGCPTMAISQNDWPKINTAISKAIEGATSPLINRIEELRPHGWRKAVHTLRDWGVLGVTATIILGLLSLAASQFYYANSRLTKETAFQTSTEDTLKQINERLKTIETQSQRANEYIDGQVKMGIHESADLPQGQFNQKLGVVASRLNASVHQAVIPDPSDLRLVREKLEKAPDSLPNYWPALGSLTSVASFSGKKDRLTEALTLPDCPRPPDGTNLIGYTFPHNCAVVLDGWSFIDSKFYGTVIKYRGGPVILKNDTFTNCTFIIELPPQPSPESKTFTRAVWARIDMPQFTIQAIQSDVG